MPKPRIKASRQEARELPDPTERHLRIPKPFVILGILLVSASLGYIANSTSNQPSDWGDSRTREELAPPLASKSVTIDGAAVFASRCVACHQANGSGLPGVFPPLAESEWVQGDPRITAAIVLNGLTGAVQVRGHAFNGAMPTFKTQLSDDEIAAVLDHVRSHWGNAAAPITAGVVAEVRKSTSTRDGPFQGEVELRAWR